MTIKFRSIRSTSDAECLDHVPGEVGGACGWHYVRPSDEGLRLGEQLLGNLDAVPGGILGGEGGELVADAPGDADAGCLVVEELGLAGATQRHQAQQNADPAVA